MCSSGGGGRRRKGQKADPRYYHKWNTRQRSQNIPTTTGNTITILDSSYKLDELYFCMKCEKLNCEQCNALCRVLQHQCKNVQKMLFIIKFDK